MNDPERFLHGASGGLEARLLRAGAAEMPSERSLERTLAALGAAATTLGTAGVASAVGAASSGKAAAALTVVGLVKWAGVGVASGVVVSLAAHAVRVEPVVHAPSSRAAEHETRVAPAERAPTVSLPPAPALEATPEPPSHLATPPAPSMKEDEALAAPLAAEVAFVDRGRSAFQAGQHQAALAFLEGYEREYPERRLLPEVLYLRMEAYAGSGDSARAGDLGRRILRQFPKSPHAFRARAVLGLP